MLHVAVTINLTGCPINPVHWEPRRIMTKDIKGTNRKLRQQSHTQVTYICMIHPGLTSSLLITLKVDI